VSAALASFLIVATLLIVAPGPDSLLVVRNTMRGGRWGGLATAAGTLTGLSVWAVAAALGLAALVRASELGYDALRLAGAGYLIWLGVMSLRSRSGSLREATYPTKLGNHEHNGSVLWRRGRMYAMGTLSNLLNPKIGVFFVAFLPGFIPAGASIGVASAVLGAVFVAETGLWLVLLSWCVLRGVGWLRRPRVQTVVDRIAGVVLIGFGVRLAATTR
jgi:threonine/homoserine/homoserine lactone efflux protein